MAAERSRPVTEARRGPRHARRLPSHRVARAVGMVMTAVLAMVGTAAAALYIDLKNSVTVNNALAGLQTGDAKPKNPSDPFSGQALNLLIIGTDYRDAENAALAGKDEGGMRADTTMLVHVSANRKWIEVFSIPRDLLVTIPSCEHSDKSKTKERRNQQFNWAFGIGAGSDKNMTSGARCTAETVQKLTGITPNHLMVIKMSGVVKIVDALDGVTMCLPEAMHEYEQYGKLDLPAGKVHLNGRTALEYLRARHGMGFGLDDGTDITRIVRQQAFLNALQYQITASGVLSDPTRVYPLAKAVLGATEVDQYLGNIQAWPGLAWGLRNLNSSNVRFTELNLGIPSWDPNRRILAAGAAESAENEALFQRFVKDTEPPKANTGSNGTAGTGSGGTLGTGTSGTGTAGEGATAPVQGTGQGPAAGTQGSAATHGGTGAAPTPTSTLPVGVCPS